jgi:hypothetical protein
LRDKRKTSSGYRRPGDSAPRRKVSCDPSVIWRMVSWSTVCTSILTGAASADRSSGILQARNEPPHNVERPRKPRRPNVRSMPSPPGISLRHFSISSVRVEGQTAQPDQIRTHPNISHANVRYRRPASPLVLRGIPRRRPRRNGDARFREVYFHAVPHEDRSPRSHGRCE